MHGLILAGGEGSRLAADGITDPKAAVSLHGRPQIVRLSDTLRMLGCTTVTCMVRDDARGAFEVLDQFAAPDVQTFACRTPSSLHTLVEGLAKVPRGPVFCTMVDTVMPQNDWRRVYSDARDQLLAGADAVLAVTPYVDDDRPLWVERDGAGWVSRVGGPPVVPPCVTGGVYAFAPTARREAPAALQDGCHRLREFLGRLVDDGARVAAVEVERIVDVDRKRDLEAAMAIVLADAGAPIA